LVMAVMAKKSKKAKSGVEQSAEAALGDIAATVEADVEVKSEDSKKKKKKKSKENNHEESAMEVSASEPQSEVISREPPAKKKKKKSKENNHGESVIEVSASEPPSEVLSKEEPPAKKKKKKSKDTTVVAEKGSDEAEKEQSQEGVEASEEANKVLEKVEDSEKTKGKGKVSVVNSAKNRLKDDLSYISDFLSFLHIPQHRLTRDEQEDEEEEEGEMPQEARERLLLIKKPGERAASREELQERLKKKMDELRGSFGPNDKKKAKKLKRRMAALDKEKEGKELKQKLMQIGINAGKKGSVIGKDVEAMGAKMTKPGVKTEKGVVFSKFDFQEMEKEKKRQSLDPATALKKIQKSKEKVKLWDSKGKSEKARNIENNIAWENATAKAMGEKVKDDETLLKKAIKKKQQIKGSKKKKWENRVEAVESKKAGKQSKREENISKRKKEKKDKKMKHAVAKGRHVPGF